MEENFLSTKEASKLMNLSDMIVRELCREGKLTGAYQPGEYRPWKIPESSVLEWVNSEKPSKQNEPEPELNEPQENSLPTDVTRKPFFERKWFMAITAIVALFAGIVGFLSDSGIGEPFVFFGNGRGGPKYECNLAPPEFTDGEFGILIADFTNGLERNPSREGQELADRTHQALSTRLKTSTSTDNVEIRRVCFIRDDTDAIELAETSNASLIVWGNIPEFAEDIFTPSFLIADDPQLLIKGESIMLQSEIIGVTNADLPNHFSMRVKSAAAFMLGVYYLNETGEYKLAIPEFTEAIQQTEPELDNADPNSEQEVAMKRTLAVYYVLRGRSYAALGNSEQALSDYQTSEIIDDLYYGTFVGRGNYNYSKHEFDLAEEQYRMALDRQENASGYYGLANSLVLIR